MTKQDKATKLLQQLQVPEPDEKAKAQTLYRARVAFLNQANAPADNNELLEKSGWNLWSIRTAAGMVAACALIVFGYSLGRFSLQEHPQVAKYQSDDKAWVERVAYTRKLLDETAPLFPEQLQAIVSNGGGPQLQLRESPRHTLGEPVLVELNKDGKSLRIVTYSGESVRLTLSEQETQLEVLVTGDGGILVFGDTFAWSSSQPRTSGGYQVKAQRLGI